jgi:superfamily II DNA/RNA helicase
LLIIDEADLILRNFFFPEVEIFLVRYNPKQILLLSANIIKNLFILKFPKFRKKIFYFFEKKNKVSVVDQIVQEYIFCPIEMKFIYLIAFLKVKNKISRADQKRKNITMIFTSSKIICENLSEKLLKSNIPCIKLHSGMDHLTKFLSIQILKNSNCNVFICTDLGSRGLDLANIDFIINFNFPKTISTYFHRVGRTGRFFKKGYCLNLICQKEIYLMHSFEKMTGIKFIKTNIIKENKIIKFLSQ